MGFGVYKQEIESLAVRYSVLPISRQYSYDSSGIGANINTINQVYECRRIATRRYKYVGMDAKTAESYVSILTQAYMRDCYYSKWNGNTGQFSNTHSGSRLLANITSAQVAGCLYEVVIDIQEDEVKYSTQAIANPKSMFGIEENRNYDL